MAGAVVAEAEVAGAPEAQPLRRRRLPLAALVAGVVAVLGSALLPLAPVAMEQPVVSWPQSASAPRPTMLQLTAQTPLALDARFSCAAARVADGTADGVLLATVVPDQPGAAGQGLLVTAADGGLTVVSNGTTLVQDAPIEGDCSYAITGSAAGLSLSRDGRLLGRGAPGELPAVDVLATSVTALSPSAGEELAVQLTVDDQFATSPSPLKWTLIALVLLGAALCVAFLVAEQRAAGAWAPRLPAASRARRLGVLDVVVPLVMTGWVFLAPMSDDDGYYTAMARDSVGKGTVGNYYQLLDQSFTPFTWFYRLLGYWQQVGDSPVVLRVPALVTGVLTWFVVRRFTTGPGALPPVLERSRSGRAALTGLLALAFLAWWLPYGMGVRPEAVVGFLAAATLLAVNSAVRRRSLPLMAVAVVAAALSAVCHPTGFVALAPLLVGLPAMVRVLRAGVPARRAWLRALAVVAPGAVAAVAAFGDGTLNDFTRGQQIFLSIQEQNDWFDEYQRWSFLLSPIPMGSYARRAAILLAVACLLWWAVLTAASRRRGAAWPQLLFAGQSLGLAFLLLWLTPSKWTHHFGALDGLGPAFLALFLVSLPVMVRALPGGLRSGWLVAVPAVGTAVLVFALSFHGPNDWPYSWMQGVPQASEMPHLTGSLGLDSTVFWLAGILAVVVLVRVLPHRLGLPRRRPWLTALPVAVSGFLALTVLYLFGGFAYAAASTMDTWSPWADAVTDPLGHRCGAAQAIDVLDVESARPLPPTAGTGDPSGVFTAGGGFYPASPPPTAVGTGPVTQLWGSLSGETDGSAVGHMASPWYPLPSGLPADQQLAVLVSGTPDTEGNFLFVDYGRTGATGVEVLDTEPVTDGAQSSVWRTHPLDVPAGAAGADSVRLVAFDGATGPSGWLAFSGPSVVPTVQLSRYLPDGATVATAWQFAFLFPCQRQPAIRDGITEPMDYAVMWGNGGVSSLDDNTWQLPRGGLFAPTLRDSSLTLVGGRFPDWPEITTAQVFRVVAPYADRGYDVREQKVTRWGWQGPEEARWPYPGPTR